MNQTRKDARQVASDRKESMHDKQQVSRQECMQEKQQGNSKECTQEKQQ